MQRHKWLALGAILLAVTGVIIGWVLDSSGTPAPASGKTENPLAPHPVTPPDQTVFVDSDIVLQWEWLPGLKDGQVFAVRVWYGDKPPIETWTQEASLDAQSFIDSYSRDLGEFHWQVAVINVSPTEGFVSMGSEWSPLQTLNRVRRFIPTPYPESQQSDTARFIVAQHLSSRTETIDYVRHFINVNSTDDFQEPGLPDRSDTIAKMLAYSQGQGEIPHLLCDGRAIAMLSLLQELGIESRLIFLYTDGGSYILEHTALEVFNPDTQRWESHDPSADIYFLDTDTGERASIERLVFGPLDSIVGCDARGCSAERAATREIFFAAFRYGYDHTFWVNPDRFDVSKRFPANNNANLAEYLTGNPRDFSFQFDSWNR